MPESRILIIDDQPVNLRVLETLLTRSGYDDVRTTTSPLEGLELCRTCDPDLILLDLHMPEMDGFTVLERLQPVLAEPNYLPIIVLTADDSVDAKRKALSMGAKDFLAKTFDSEEALQRIRNLLETRSLHVQLRQQNRRLEERVGERTRELVESNRELRQEVSARLVAEEHLAREAARAESLLRISARLSAQLDLQSVLDILCEEARTALHAPAALVRLCDREFGTLSLAAERGLPAGYARDASVLPWRLLDEVLTDRTGCFAIQDLSHGIERSAVCRQYGLRSLGAALIADESGLIGVLAVVYLDEEYQVSHDELSLLKGLSDHAALAISNARLFEATHEHLKRLQSLRQIDIAIAGSLDRTVTLDVVVNEAMQRLSADAAEVLYYRPDEIRLSYATGRGMRTDPAQRTRIRLDSSVAGSAVTKRQTISIPDVRETPPAPTTLSFLQAEGFAAYHGVPLIAKGRVLGVLEVFHRSPYHPPSDWLRFLEALAGQAAIALDSAQLFEELQQSNTDLRLAYDVTLEGWVKALDLRDNETEGHTQRVAELAVRLAEALGLGAYDVAQVRRGALLHDIGKIGVPDAILHKPGPLTDEERAVMYRHPEFAFDLLSPIDYLRPALDIPYCHHEKWDGTGYPRGISGDRIPLAARLFAVVDVWDALRSDRPYRKRWSDAEVIDHLRRSAGSHFEPRLVEVFIGQVVR